MRDQEMQLSELKKDNFGLKLRIYHLEEALRKQLGNDSDDWRLNIDLNVQLDSLKKDLQEKSELLLKAKFVHCPRTCVHTPQYHYTLHLHPGLV
jgi:hypothetical protein